MAQRAPPHPILKQHFDSSAVAFTKIDEEIAILQESIRALHAFRNTFTPVYSLPPEVLSRIFSLVRHATSWDMSDKSSTSFKWLVLTSVSQHWRNVAIGSPDLWTHLSNSYPKHVFQEWLQRSKGTPLSIDLYRISPSFAEFITASLPRIRELTLKLSATSWNGLLHSLSFPAPLLESLRICISNATIPVEGWIWMVSDAMFAGSTPRLRNLEVVGCSVDINSSIFRDLTVLELCNIPRKLSATDILTTLRKIPLLTSLGLSYLLEYGAGPAPPQIGAVVLSSLKSLQISGQFFPHDLDFLSHLSFPATSVLHFISYTLDEEAIPALSDFLDVHKTARQQSSNAILCSINLQCSWSVLTLSLNTECDEQGHGHVADLVKFELASRWSGNLDLPDTPDIASFFSFFSLSSLRSITTNCKFDIGVWTKIFGTLPKLKRIVTTGDCAITGHCAIELLSSIIDDFQVNCPTGPRKNPQNQAGAGGKKKKKGKGKGKQKSQAAHWEPIFPSLEVIQMHDMVFTEQIVEDLVSAFRARKAAEKVMGIIGMTKCLNVEDDTVEALQEVVDHVVWDGWTGDKTWSIPDEESVHDSHGSGGFEGNYDGADDNNWDFS